MRWNATRKASWVMATWFVACGFSMADEPRPARVSITSVQGVPKDSPAIEAPPINVRPPSILNLAPTSVDDGAIPPSRPTTLPPRITNTVPIQTPAPVPDVKPLVAPTPPTRSTMPPSVTVPPTVAPLPNVPTLTEIPQTPTVLPETTLTPSTTPCNDCKPTNPWAKVPTPELFPRLGFYTVPGSGPGYYSFADVLHGQYRAKPPAFPYPPFILQPPGFFNADYRYLDKPDNTQTDFFDFTKRQHLTEDTMFSVGGQHSIRYMHENDARLGRVDNHYSLLRNRVYGDFWYRDHVRIYGEFINAMTIGQTLPALPIDDNKADILNLFADVKLLEVAGNPLYARVGRQELLYGSQRLVSTLDWANTRRTFQGAKAFWHSEHLDLDAFWVRPVTIRNDDLDTPDNNVQFFGAWATLKPKQGMLLDLYYLGLKNDNRLRSPFAPPAPQPVPPTAPPGTQELHTIGARFAGNEGQLLYDFEGMLQHGDFFTRDLSAYAYTTALGWEFKNVPCRPQLWFSHDYASGTSNPATGKYTTFQQLFPFGHYYLGYIDFVGRQNIHDLSAQLAFYPDNWITCIAQYHTFQLAQARDSLYNAAGRPTRRSPTGTAGRDVGQEVDFLVNFHLSQHQDFMVGYSKFFAGDFIKRTGPNVSPDFLYLMYNFRW